MEGPGKSRSRRGGSGRTGPTPRGSIGTGAAGGQRRLSAGIAAAFFLVPVHPDPSRGGGRVPRPGQWIPHDVVSRVDFAYRDKDLLAHAAAEARRRAPRLQGQPRRRGRRPGAAPPRAAGPPDRLVDPNSLVDGKLAEKLEAGRWTAAVLRQYASGTSTRAVYEQKVNDFVHAVRTARAAGRAAVGADRPAGARCRDRRGAPRCGRRVWRVPGG